MPKFRVTVGYFVSQCLDIESDTYEAAIDEAFDQVDTPNSSNKFDQDGDPELIAVYDENDTLVSERR